MSTEIEIVLNGHDTRVVLDNGYQGVHAYGFVFGLTDIVKEFESKHFIGYCHAEIALNIITDLLDGIEDVDYDDIVNALMNLDYVCECDA